MKKILLYSLAALASISLASCNGDYDDWAAPQTNPTEAEVAKYNITFTAGPESNVVMPHANEIVQLVTINTSSTDITGYTIKKVTINGEEIGAKVEGANVIVDANELAKLIEKQNNSRASVARNMDIVTMLSANLASGDAVTVDLKGETNGQLTPAATPTIDSKGYYLLGDFAGVGFDTTKPLWMTANGDGTFTAIVNTVNTGSNWFKFYQGSHYESGNWDTVNAGAMGVPENGDDSSHGFIVYTGDDAAHAPTGVQTAVIPGKGRFEITIDMNNLTYTVKRAEAMYYLVGNVQSATWNEKNKDVMLYMESDNIYSYTTKFNGGWDLKIWSGAEFGNWDVAWGCEIDGSNAVSGSLINKKGQAISAPTKAEYYTFTADMNSKTYTWTKLTNQSPESYANVSLIGDFNNWNGDVDLTQEANAPHNWHARVNIPSDGALKFRANHDWTTSWGTSTADKATIIGDVYTLSTGGENITVPAGTYDFYLNDITGKWNIVIVNE